MDWFVRAADHHDDDPRRLVRQSVPRALRWRHVGFVRFPLVARRRVRELGRFLILGKLLVERFHREVERAQAHAPEHILAAHLQVGEGESEISVEGEVGVWVGVGVSSASLFFSDGAGNARAIAEPIAVMIG